MRPATRINLDERTPLKIAQRKPPAKFLPSAAHEQPRRIAFRVPAVPVPQPRPRASVFIDPKTKKAHPSLRTADSKHAINRFKAAVAYAAERATDGRLLEGALRLTLLFVMPRPASRTKKRGPNPREWDARKVDPDNLAKGVMDALNGVVWPDDSSVRDLRCFVVMAAGGEPAHVDVVIESLTETEPPKGLF